MELHYRASLITLVSITVLGVNSNPIWKSQIYW